MTDIVKSITQTSAYAAETRAYTDQIVSVTPLAQCVVALIAEYSGGLIGAIELPMISFTAYVQHLARCILGYSCYRDNDDMVKINRCFRKLWPMHAIQCDRISDFDTLAAMATHAGYYIGIDDIDLLWVHQSSLDVDWPAWYTVLCKFVYGSLGEPQKK